MGRIVQEGRSVPVNAGSVTMYATDRPYRQDYSRPRQRQLIIQVSRRALRLPAEMIDDACHRLLIPSSSAGRLLFDYVERASAATDLGAADVSMDLAETLIRGSYATGPTMPRTARGLLETIRDHVERNFTSPHLTVDTLAAEHFLSRRRLYQLFDEAGESPAERIRSRRLEHAAALLRDDDQRAIGVTEACERSGFSDATTFARAFRRKYGINPREFRESSAGS